MLTVQHEAAKGITRTTWRRVAMTVLHGALSYLKDPEKRFARNRESYMKDPEKSRADSAA